jgi:adenosine kinase
MANQEGIIFGIGNPLLDISAVVPMSVIEKYELKTNNAILAEEKHMPLYQELVDNYPVDYTAGGATQNAIRVAQWILQSPVNATTYVGCIGQDRFGATLEEAATKANVKVHYMKVEGVPTGTCAVVIVGHERSLVANISAAGKFQLPHLETPESQSLMAKAEVFYSAGFFLTASPESALYVAKYAFDNKKIFSINLAAPFICQFFHDALMSEMPYADYVFGNESEATAFAETKKWETKDISEIATKIAQLPRAEGSTRERLVVITQGSHATIVASPTTVRSFDVPKIPANEIIDTNGAGDAFVGGFLAQLVRGKSLEISVDAGHYAAGVVLRHSGCTFPSTHNFVPSA